MRQTLKLLRAYYDDAVTLPVLKTEQHRLANQIEAINARIDAHHGDYANAKAELDDTLDLLADAASIYERGDDETRRLCNQAFFTKVYLDENDHEFLSGRRSRREKTDPQMQPGAAESSLNRFEDVD
jgi:hypothetical protein